MTIATAWTATFRRLALLLPLVHTCAEAAKYAKICALPSMADAVELTYGGSEGFFVVEDGGTSSDTVTVAAADQTAARGGQRTYLALPCPCDDFKRTYCMIEGPGPTPDSCGVAYSNHHDVFIAMADRDDNMTSYYNNSDIGCFSYDQQTMFVRNAWPVVVLWYSALLVFILATANGKWARGYITHKLCPGLRTNERAADGIIRREIAAHRRQFFARRLLGDEELGSMGWVQRAALEDMHAEYVFRTKKFSVTEERTRRERKSSLESNMESMPLDGVEATSATPTKRPESNPNTPDTVSTNSSEDDVEENESLTPDADIQSNEDESFECTICISPVDDGDQVGVTVCGHIFHSECLKQWVARKNQCPLCKAAIASPRPARSGAEEEGSATPDNPANNPVNISDEMAAAHPRRLNRFLFPNSRPTTTPSPPRPSSLSLSFSNESEPNSRSRRRRTGLIIYE